MLSCTITKRHFCKGFYVESQRKHHARSKVIHAYEDTTIRQMASVSNEMLVESNNFSSKNNTSKPLIEESVSLKLSSCEQKVYHSRNYKYLKDKRVDMKQKTGTFNHLKQDHFLYHKLDTETTKEEPKVELFTWLALGAFGLIFLFSNILRFSLVFIYIATICAGVFLICFIVFSIISFSRVIKQPNSYKARKLTYTLFGISLFFLLCFLVILIVFFIILF